MRRCAGGPERHSPWRRRERDRTPGRRGPLRPTRPAPAASAPWRGLTCAVPGRRCSAPRCTRTPAMFADRVARAVADSGGEVLRPRVPQARRSAAARRAAAAGARRRRHRRGVTDPGPLQLAVEPDDTVAVGISVDVARGDPPTAAGPRVSPALREAAFGAPLTDLAVGHGTLPPGALGGAGDRAAAQRTRAGVRPLRPDRPGQPGAAAPHRTPAARTPTRDCSGCGCPSSSSVPTTTPGWCAPTAAWCGCGRSAGSCPAATCASCVARRAGGRRRHRPRPGRRAPLDRGAGADGQGRDLDLRAGRRGRCPAATPWRSCTVSVGIDPRTGAGPGSGPSRASRSPCCARACAPGGAPLTTTSSSGCRATCS